MLWTQGCFHRLGITQANGAIEAYINSVMLFNSFIGYNAGESLGVIASLRHSSFPSVHNTIVDNPANITRAANFNANNQLIAPFNDEAGPSALLILKHCNLIDNEGFGALIGYTLTLCNSTVYGNMGGGVEGFVSFYASIIIDDINKINDVALDQYTWNLTNNPYDTALGGAAVRGAFEVWPPQAEKLGGYTPLVPLKYSGAAEGKVPSALLTSYDPSIYPWDFRTDARGVPRNHTKGASIGSYEFGEVSLLPGNIQNSTTLVFRPNATGQIKVKLVEVINVPGFPSVTNYLSNVPISFDLTSGASIGSLPQTGATEDNGRAAVTVNTLDSGQSKVNVKLANKPLLYLDLTIIVDEHATIEDDDLYVTQLTPNQTKINIENTYVATFSRDVVSSTVSIRLKGYMDYIFVDLPVTITDPLSGTINQPLSFPEKGSYMFDFTMTDSQNRTYKDTKELKVTDNDPALKIFRMSAPPFYVNKTLSLTASFTRAPREIDMTLTSATGKVYKPTMYSWNDRLEWQGFFTPESAGTYKARLEYVDGGSRTSHSEFFAIQITDSGGSQTGGMGSTTVQTHGKGGCEVLGGGLILAVLSCFVLARRRKS